MELLPHLCVLCVFLCVCVCVCFCVYLCVCACVGVGVGVGVGVLTSLHAITHRTAFLCRPAFHSFMDSRNGGVLELLPSFPAHPPVSHCSTLTLSFFQMIFSVFYFPWYCCVYLLYFLS